MRAKKSIAKRASLTGFTFQSAFGHLCSLFNRSTTRSQRAGTGAAMAALLKRQVVQLDDATRTWAVSRVLNLLEAPRWGPVENVSACATVANVLHAGIVANCSEQQQTDVLGGFEQCSSPAPFAPQS